MQYGLQSTRLVNLAQTSFTIEKDDGLIAAMVGMVDAAYSPWQSPGGMVWYQPFFMIWYGGTIPYQPVMIRVVSSVPSAADA